MNQNGTGLNLKCRAQWSCTQTSVYCPYGDAYCDIDCANGEVPCVNMSIFIANTEYDLDLYCKHSIDNCNNMTIQCQDDGNFTRLRRSTDGQIAGVTCVNQDCCPPFLAALCLPDQDCNVCIL